MIELMNYRTNEGVRSAFVKHGHKWLQVLAIDAGERSGLRIYQVPKTEERYMRPLLRKGKPYPISRALKVFKNFGKTHGMSKGVKKFLTEVAGETKATKKTT